jgi:hypothetical protein
MVVSRVLLVMTVLFLALTFARCDRALDEAACDAQQAVLEAETDINGFPSMDTWRDVRDNC